MRKAAVRVAMKNVAKALSLPMRMCYDDTVNPRYILEVLYARVMPTQVAKPTNITLRVTVNNIKEKR